MKIPVAPPSFSKLLAEAKPERLGEILGLAKPTHRGRYRHWHRLRYLKPPDGLNHEEWWIATKMARSVTMRDLPVTDSSGVPFRYTLPDAALEMIHRIDSQAHGRIAFPEQITTPEERDRYIVSSLIEEAITSSQLEGAVTTRPIAAELLRSGRKPRNHSEKMIVNNYKTMKHLRSLGSRLSVPDVLDVHMKIAEGTMPENQCGVVQSENDDRVGVFDWTGKELHSPPAASELSERMETMCRFANGASDSGFVHPIIRAIILHFWLAYDHPFADGNGRTARALFYWSMLNSGYWLFEYVSISSILKNAPARYKRAFLYTESDDNDLTYFILFQLSVVIRAIGELEAYIERKIKQLALVESMLKHSGQFNYRQLALLGHALRHPSSEYTIRSHQNSHQVAYATSRADLLDLVDQGLLVVYKKDKKTKAFSAVPDLEDRIRLL